MAVALVASSTSGTTDTQTTSKAVPVPAGAAAGMVAVLVYELWQSTAVNPVVTWPAGFTEIVSYASSTDGFQKLKAAVKVLTGADAGSYTASWANHWNQGQCTLWSGVDTATPLDAAVNLAQNSTGTTLPGNAVTTANPGCGMLHLVANENSATGLAPTGYTEQQDANYLRMNTKVAGAAGSETITGGSTSVSTLKLAALIALRPASGGGGVALTGVDSITQAQTIQSPAVAQRHTLTPAALQQAQATTAPALTQRHTLTPAGTSQAQALASPALTQRHTLTVADVIQAQTIESPALGGGSGVSPVDVVQAQSIDTVAITQRSVLTVDDVTQAQTVQHVTIPGSVILELLLTGYVEPGRWRVAVEGDRLTGDTEPDRWRTEVEA